MKSFKAPAPFPPSDNDDVSAALHLLGESLQGEAMLNDGILIGHYQSVS